MKKMKRFHQFNFNVYYYFNNILYTLCQIKKNYWEN